MSNIRVSGLKGLCLTILAITLAVVGSTAAVGAQGSSSDDGTATLQFDFVVINDWTGTSTPADFGLSLFHSDDGAFLGGFLDGQTVVTTAGEHSFNPGGPADYNLESVVCVDTATGAPHASFEDLSSFTKSIDVVAGSDTTCTITYNDRPTWILVDVEIDGLVDGFQSLGVAEFTVNGASFFGSTRHYVVPGSYTVEPIGGPGLELTLSECGRATAQGLVVEAGPAYDVTLTNQLFCRFHFVTVETPPDTTTTTTMAPATTTTPPTTAGVVAPTTTVPATTTTTTTAAVGATEAEIPTLALTGVESEWLAIFGALTLATGIAIETSRRRSEQDH